MAREYGRALIHHPEYGKSEVPIRSSKAEAAGENGASFHAPGWKKMAFRSPNDAVRKIENHPGFKGWIGGKPDLGPKDEPEVVAAKKKVRDT